MNSDAQIDLAVDLIGDAIAAAETCGIPRAMINIALLATLARWGEEQNGEGKPFTRRDLDRLICEAHAALPFTGMGDR